VTVAARSYRKASLEVLPARPADVRGIHEGFEALNESGRISFHPGFLGSEPWTARGLAGRWLLRTSAHPCLGRLLASLKGMPFMVSSVALADARVVGFAYILVRRARGHRKGTFGIFVRPEWEGQGLGRRLAVDVLGRASAASVEEVVLTVQVGNERARALYERLGFVIVETIPRSDLYDGVAYDAHRMALQLRQPPRQDAHSR
jgi:RimJ/RimL family protein N-acetyltransferase